MKDLVSNMAEDDAELWKLECLVCFWGFFSPPHRKLWNLSNK